MNQYDPCQELKKELAMLSQKLKSQEDLLNGITEWEGSEHYKQIEVLQAKRQEKQAQYKQLMEDRYQFVRTCTSLQQAGQNFLDQKLNKNIRALIREIENVLDIRTSKSSISSCSFDKVESMDWLLQDRQEKHFKEHQKIMIEIAELQKILESIP